VYANGLNSFAFGALLGVLLAPERSNGAKSVQIRSNLFKISFLSTLLFMFVLLDLVKRTR